VGVEHHPWTSTHTLGSLALAAVLLAAFVWIESSVAAQPLVPLRIFQQRQVVVAWGFVSVAVLAAVVLCALLPGRQRS
jgi:hypothetical protein